MPPRRSRRFRRKTSRRRESASNSWKLSSERSRSFWDTERNVSSAEGSLDAGGAVAAEEFAHGTHAFTGSRRAPHADACRPTADSGRYLGIGQKNSAGK